MGLVRLLFLHKVVLLTLILTSPKHHHDADLEHNLIYVLCSTFIQTLIALDALICSRRILPTP